MELRYRRVDKEQQQQAGDLATPVATAAKVIDDDDVVEETARMDTVVMYMPDIWSLMPSQAAYDAQMYALKQQLQAKLDEIDNPPVVVLDSDADASMDVDGGDKEQPPKDTAITTTTTSSSSDVLNAKVFDTRKYTCAGIWG